MVTAGAPLDSPYKGVGGWLLFFIVSLTILSPLATLVAFAAAYSQVSPLFGGFPGLLVVTAVDFVLSAAVMSFSIYAGVGLWRIRPNAVKTAKTYLLVFLAYNGVAAFLPFLAGLPSLANEAMMREVATGVVRSIIYVVIWYSYLNKSKRVAATYIPTTA